MTGLFRLSPMIPYSARMELSGVWTGTKSKPSSAVPPVLTEDLYPPDPDFVFDGGGFGGVGGPWSWGPSECGALP